MNPYQFTILRYVHDEITAEFVNIGAVLWFPRRFELLFDISPRYSRLTGFFKGMDGNSYRQMASMLSRHIEGVAQEFVQIDWTKEPPTSLIEILPRIVQSKSGCFSWSPVMAGLTELSIEAELATIMEDFVYRYEDIKKDESRSEDQIWAGLEKPLAILEKNLAEKAQDERITRGFEIATSDYGYEYEFRLGWMNSIRQVAEPISFDLKTPSSIREKAVRWSGRVGVLQKAMEFEVNPVIAPPRDEALCRSFNNAYRILKESAGVRQVWMEDDAEGLVEQIERDLLGT